MLYGWKENSMLTNCLAACAHLTITVFEVERDIGRKSSFFIPPLHSTPALWGSRRNSVTPFGLDKLEWLGYPTVKNLEDILIRFGATHERVRQTDRQTDRETPHAGNSRAAKMLYFVLLSLSIPRLLYRIAMQILASHWHTLMYCYAPQ